MTNHPELREVILLAFEESRKPKVQVRTSLYYRMVTFRSKRDGEIKKFTARHHLLGCMYAVME